MLYLPCHIEMSTAARFSLCGIPIVVTTRGRTREVFMISVFLSFGPDVVSSSSSSPRVRVCEYHLIYLPGKHCLYQLHTGELSE